jgi:hypothetical protein
MDHYRVQSSLVAPIAAVLALIAAIILLYLPLFLR